MRYLYYLIFISVFCACKSTPTLYQPEPLSTYRFEKAKELIVETSASSSDEIKGLRANLVYSPMKHLFIGANYNQIGTILPNLKGEDEPARGYAQSFGGQIGGYYPLSKRAIVNLIGGVYFLENESLFGADKKASLNATKFNLQSTITLQSGRFRLGYGVRLNLVKYRTANINITIPDDFLASIDALKVDPQLIIPELGLDVGYVFSKFYLKAGMVNMVGGQNDNYFAVTGTSITLGFQPSLLFKKNKETPIIETN